MVNTTNDLIERWRNMGPAAWAECSYGWFTDDKRPVILLLWQRAVLGAWFDHRDSVTILGVSNIKKTGKTFLNAIMTAWRWLAIPGQHFCLGNDMDQSLSRQFAMISEMVERHPYLKDHVKVTRNELIFLPTGSKLTTLSVDAAGNAGANHWTSSHTEAWGIIYESAVRAFEELTIPPGQQYGLPALRICDSYAGFEGESKTWHDMVDRGLKGERISKDWPIFLAGGLLLFHAEGAWAQTHCFRGTQEEAKAYYEDQRSTLRANAFIRMHENRRTSGESAFLPEGLWDRCRSQAVKPITQADKIKLVLGADASTSRDLTALVGVYYNKETSTVDVGLVRVWKPRKLAGIRFGKPTIDLDETIGQEVMELHAMGMVAEVVCDPFQLHTCILKWEKAGIKVFELAQNAGRVEADQGLYDAVIGGGIRHFGHPDLDDHMQHAVALETPRGYRLAKEKASLKIDLAVALSMARYRARESKRRQGTVGSIADPFANWPPPDGCIYDPQEGWVREYEYASPAPNHGHGLPNIKETRGERAVQQFWHNVKEKSK